MAFFQRPQSAAIPIIAPSEPRSTASSPAPSTQRVTVKRDTAQKHCRNILIYGSCKFEGKGCTYYHPPKPGDASSDSPPESPIIQNVTPTTLAADAPVFVPKISPGSPLLANATPADIVRALSPQAANVEPGSSTNIYNGYEGYDTLNGGMAVMSVHDGHDMNDMTSSYYSMEYQSQPLEYHLYTATMPQRMTTDPQRPHVAGYFMSSVVREMLLRRAQAARSAPPPGSFGLPEEVSGYHSLVPLEAIGIERRRTFGPYHGTLYRALKTSDGLYYALRRVENFRLTHEAAFTALEPWTRLRHPNIVSVREGFTTRAFGDDSLVVVYDFHGDSQTLAEKHIRQRLHRGRNQNHEHLPEATLWSYVVQIANAIKAVHDRGLAVRQVDLATKIINTGRTRVRLSMCGVLDMFAFNQIQDVALIQQHDLAEFGKLIIQLACQNASAHNTLPKAIDIMSRHYSPELKNIAIYLYSKSSFKSINHVFEMIGPTRLLQEMDNAHDYSDNLESDLMSELENGRLVRLLCKFGFINERPEFGMDPRWAETGERYPIKLFRDYVFHQVDPTGHPVVNLGHVITCLNKLDAGSEERIMLISREEQSCLVITYGEIKACIESAFSELSSAR